MHLGQQAAAVDRGLAQRVASFAQGQLYKLRAGRRLKTGHQLAAKVLVLGCVERVL